MSEMPLEVRKGLMTQAEWDAQSEAIRQEIIAETQRIIAEMEAAGFRPEFTEDENGFVSEIRFVLIDKEGQIPS